MQAVAAPQRQFAPEGRGCRRWYLSEITAIAAGGYQS
jgi:hypothetical protein